MRRDGYADKRHPLMYRGRPIQSAARSHSRRAGRGQALTELALIAPIMMVILMGVLDLGRAYHTQVALSNAARVGLVYGQQVVSPRGCVSVTCPFLTAQQIISQTVAEAQGGITISAANVTLYVASSTAATSTTLVGPDEPITITISVPFHSIMPFIHLGAVSGSASGRTFTYDPVVPTPYGNTAPTATPTPTPGLIPTPVGLTGATITPTNTMNALACPSGSLCYAVGAAGAFAINNGSWATATTISSRNLNGIACLSSTSCFAVGDAGTIIYTSNASLGNGATWTISGGNLTTQDLNAVSCDPLAGSGEPKCVAVGNNGTILSYNGSTWSLGTDPNPYGLNGVSCSDAAGSTAETCFAVGVNGTILMSSGGGAWSAQVGNVAVDLNAVSCVDTSDIPGVPNCVAVGNSGVVVYTSNGGSTPWTSARPATSDLNGVTCGLVTSGGTITDSCYTVGSFGTILSGTDATGSPSWNPVGSGTYNALNAVACPSLSSPIACTAVGASGSSVAYGMPMPTATPTNTPTATPTSVPTTTPTPTATTTPTKTPTPAPTNTPGGPTNTPTPVRTSTATATPTPANTATASPTSTAAPTATPANTATPAPTATPTPEPAPVTTALACTGYKVNNGGHTGSAQTCSSSNAVTYVTISWTTNETDAGNTIYVRPQGSTSAFTAYQASNGTAPALSFHVNPALSGQNNYTFLPANTYEYYIQSASSTPLTTTVPSGCPSACTLSGTQVFQLQ